MGDPLNYLVSKSLSGSIGYKGKGGKDMGMFKSLIMLSLLVGFITPLVHAKDLYFVDAHSQLDANFEPDEVLQKMDQGGVYKTILSTRGGRKLNDVVKLARRFPERIIPCIKIKGRHYQDDTRKYYKKLTKRVNSGKFGAMGEVLLYHAQKGNLAPEVHVRASDKRVQTALQYAIDNDWPFIVHIEFASLGSGDRDAYMNELEILLKENPGHPFALIHMGQLETDEVARLIQLHNNIYFMTSHADPVVASSNQPWINMMDGNRFKPKWQALIQSHPERFIFAIDNVWTHQWRNTYMEHIRLWRSALSALPDKVAHAVAHGNAERLWKLSPKE